MRIGIVYYSLEGNTEYAVKLLAKEMDATLIRIQPVKDYPKGKVSKFFWAGKSVVFGETPKLEKYEFNVNDYDSIILATPVWSGTFASPLKTFLKENNLKNQTLGFLACCSGDPGKCFEKLAIAIGSCNIKATLTLKDPLVHKDKTTIPNLQNFAQKLLVV